jgi:hypothetical protein
MEHGFNPADIALFDLKQLRNLPGPIDLFMIEKSESKNDTAFSIHCHEAAIQNPRYNTLDSLFELFLAAHLHLGYCLITACRLLDSPRSFGKQNSKRAVQGIYLRIARAL